MSFFHTATGTVGKQGAVVVLHFFVRARGQLLLAMPAASCMLYAYERDHLEMTKHTCMQAATLPYMHATLPYYLVSMQAVQAKHVNTSSM
jgi:hypothetical protein